MLNLTHPSIFPSFPLWVREIDRTISASRSKAYSLLLNSFLWLFPALTLTTFWILKCEPQAWMCYLIRFSLSALYGGKLTSLILLTTFPVCSFPGNPCPCLSAHWERCLHRTTRPQWPPAFVQGLCYTGSVLLVRDNLHSSSLQVPWSTGCRNASQVSPAYPAAVIPSVAASSTTLSPKLGLPCHLSVTILHYLPDRW